MRARRFLAMLWLALAAAAPDTGAAATQFAFAAFGDTPYSAAEELQFPAMIEAMNRERLAVVIHVGDFKNARTECSDALFGERRKWFDRSESPFVFVPGDNEWTDCERPLIAHPPLERMAKLRELFFAGDATLGRKPLRVERQAQSGYPEHMRWVHERVLFATLNVPGPDNNARLLPDEARVRTPAVLEWMRAAFRTARESGFPALVLVLHANPWSGVRALRPIIEALADEAQRYPGEVLVVHGDTHRYRFDRPLIDPRSGERVANVTRLEVFGSPFVDWVHVTVDLSGARARFSALPGSQVATPPWGVER